MLIRDLGLIYLHPTKTAGTSIEYAFLEYIHNKPITEKQLTPEQKQLYNCYHCSNQHDTWTIINDKFKNTIDQYKVVVSVRHPYNRVISEFRYQLSYMRPEQIAILDGFKDNDINIAIANNNLWNNCRKYHNTPLSEYYVENVFVLRYESLNDDYVNFQNWLNVKLPPLKHLNKSKGKNNIVLNDHSKHIVYNMFKNDFELFNYEP